MKKLIIILLGITLFLLACDIDESTGPSDNPEPEPVNELVINEFMSHNDTAWPGPNNDYPDWIELYNGSDVTVDVGGMYLTDKLDELTMSMIPTDVSELTTLAPGEFLVLIADGNPENGPLHLDFKLSDNEDFALVDTDGNTIIDQHNSGVIADDMSEGRVPDGYTNWEILDPSTPGEPNGDEPDPQQKLLFINEFMASNDYGPVDEHGNNDDWIEIYNAGNVAVDIGGMYMTDDLADLTNSLIPDTSPELTTIEPGGFLVLWADKEPEQGVLHLEDMKLSGSGEQIGLIDADGTTVIDSLTYGEQTADISYGRLPDGSDNWEYFGEGYDSNYTPGSPNGGGGTTPDLTLCINEFLASNDFNITDEHGDHDDWIEIYNYGTEAIDIGGMYMTDDLTDPTNSLIPDTNPELTTIDPGGYLILWADKEPEQGVLHLDDMKLSGSGEQIGLIGVDGITFIDSLTYGEQTTDVSMGRLPDGGNTWEYFGEGYDSMPTPGAANGSGDAPEAILFINEFLASNDTGHTDENGDFDDWIEIYNAGNIPKDLGGMYFTDDLTDLTNSMIPNDAPDVTTIAPGGYLILWADKEPEQGALHLEDMKLSGSGEEIGMIDVDGETIIDSYVFGEQTTDVSEGRLPDGGDTWEFFTTPTPGAPNE
ncbi:MAG: lamin tail domain-containing protein [Candidatus Cloacimonadales bacterium]